MGVNLSLSNMGTWNLTAGNKKWQIIGNLKYIGIFYISLKY